MAIILDSLVQLGQLLLVLALAPLLTGYVRKVKARLLRRQGPDLIQPYRDLHKLLRKEVVLADNASWVFRVAPYLIFATTWVAAALVPTFATGLAFSPAADLIAIIALLGSARFMLALAGLDVGTSFGGIGSSREMMIASLAEPALLMIAPRSRFWPVRPALFGGNVHAGPAGLRVAGHGARRFGDGGRRREHAVPVDCPRRTLTHHGAQAMIWTTSDPLAESRATPRSSCRYLSVIGCVLLFRGA
jgi:hypothetical protein